ncbi:MAG: ABC transporter permease [Desulfurococcales archaeon]|nr:ABC transporter permease [Desulfurococcales archaeon]
MGRGLLSQLYGQVASITVSQLRFKAVMISLPLVSLLPTYFALVFGLPKEELGIVLTGAVISPAVWVGVGLIQDIVYEREDYRYLEMLIASPMRPAVYILSRIMAGTLISMTTSLPLALLYTYITGSYRVLPLAIALPLIVSIFLAPLSMLLGLRLRSIKEAGSMPSLLSSLIVFLPPVYYAPGILPEWLRTPAMAIPSAAAAEVLRAVGISGYQPILDPGVLLAYLLAASTVSLLVLYSRFNWSLE